MSGVDNDCYFLKPKYPSLLLVVWLLTGFFFFTKFFELQVTIVDRKAVGF